MQWNVYLKLLRLSNICYIVKSSKEVMGQHVKWSIYFPNFYTHLMCGLVFWGGDPGTKGTLSYKRGLCELSVV
jgi:hypothetical protein